ncbi:HNH endonuclease [Thiocapsa sp.]|uniref:HNH endonuclease n=1 Tax=Thiocapsa sp. TaxID=2024551 RepID=UPI0039C981B5
MDLFNGLLLAPQIDAAFDRGFMTIDDAGRVIVSNLLGPAPRQILGLDKPLRVHRLDDKHRAFPAWHREHIFRRTAGLPKAPVGDTFACRSD